MLSYRDSADGKLKSEALDPLELIRSLASSRPAQGSCSRAALRMAKSRGTQGIPKSSLPARSWALSHPARPKSEPPRCPFCNGLLAQIARIAPQRGPPLCQAILKAAA